MLARLMLQKNKFPHTMLQTQYRMHPEISKFSNTNFYDGSISDSSHVSERRCLYFQNSVGLPAWMRMTGPGYR